jgi:predicted negative regulator of RcsB-dependent stress response
MNARNKGLLWGIILGILALFGWQRMKASA